MTGESAGCEAKATMREEARRRRAALTDRAERSARILARLLTLEEYQQARTILCYVSVRAEVETRTALEQLLREKARVVVPYCQGDSLQLFHLRDLAELESGAFGILEPPTRLRADLARQLPGEEIELAVVPGLAFDRLGGRIGYGRGYFDKLLHQLQPTATLVGLAFATQLVASVPCEPHDIRMHYVITEDELIRITR